MANRFLSLHRAALLLALLPISAQAAGLKSTTEETIKALTAINIPVQKMRGGLYMKTDDNFIVMVNSTGNYVQSLEYISTTTGDAKSLELHKKNISKLMAIALPGADEDWSYKFIKGFFDKSKETPSLSQIYAATDKATGTETDFASVIVRYKPKTGAFLFRLDATQPESPVPEPTPVAAAPKRPVATALRPTLNEATALLANVGMPIKKVRDNLYMFQSDDYYFDLENSGQKITLFSYTGQLTKGSDSNVKHILRAKVLLDYFVPGVVEGDKENEVGHMLAEIAKNLGQPPERKYTIGDGIDVKSHYFKETGILVITAKPQ